MSIVRFVTVAALAASALVLTMTGCGSDCSGESIFHCPTGASLECVSGRWACLPGDLSGESTALDLSSRSSGDLASHGD